MKRYLHYRAGPGAFRTIGEHGFHAEMVKVFAGPAGGPKWFVSVGFDRALMASRFLETSGGRVLLVGSSAGGWRVLAMACRNPQQAYEKLRIAYSRNVFTEKDTPRTLSAALRRNVESFIHEKDVPTILEHPAFDIAIHTVRGRGPAGSERRWIQGAAIT
jgi:hypothetical protein